MASLNPTPEILNELDAVNRKICVDKIERVKKRKPESTKKRTKRARAVPQEPRHSKTRSRAERRKKAKTKRKKRRAETRVRVLRKDRHNARKVDTNARGPARRRKVCADRERALCKWDN